MKQHKAYLIKEKKIVFVDTIHWNKGCGGALEVYINNPKFLIERDVIDINAGIPDAEDVFLNPPFFTYINHVLEGHLKETPHEFILLRPIERKDKDGLDVYEGDIVNWPHLAEIYEIYYNTDESHWYARPIDSKNETESYLDSTHMKVIGSIHLTK